MLFEIVAGIGRVSCCRSLLGMNQIRRPSVHFAARHIANIGWRNSIQTTLCLLWQFFSPVERSR